MPERKLANNSNLLKPDMARAYLFRPMGNCGVLGSLAKTLSNSMNTLTSQFVFLPRFIGLCLCLIVFPANSDSKQLLAVTDLRVESELLARDNRVLMIEFSSDSCGYCRKLEKEFLEPMLKNDEYRKKVLIRTVSIDEGYDLIDFQGEGIATIDFASRYQVSLTPTLLFLDSQGREVSERLIGLWSLDYFGIYIDDRIDTALEQM